jgi:NRAMP (natural resistance-associated macrophage protein)-like metal ion transporter
MSVARQPEDSATGITARVRSALGPGLITGAADDDPSGIATYAQAGARFGYELGWTLLFSYPLMVAIQAISARIGRTTGHGIAGNLRRHYPVWILQPAAALLCFANTVNIGADLGAMAEATRLLVHGLPSWAWVLLYGVGCAAAQILFDYVRYVRILKWLTLSLLTYFAVLGTVRIPWGHVLAGVFWPHLSSSGASWEMVVGLLGTTISPYLLFWQASLEVEDIRVNAVRAPLLRRPKQAASALARIRLDTVIGMALSNLVALAILVTTAATVRRGGVHDITTAAQAADALKPFAGEFAFALFACGIIGTGLLAVPALAGSAAYALAETRRWPVGLAHRVRKARRFYASLAAFTLIGAAANVLGLNPIKALVLAAVINGVVAVPLMAVVVHMASSPQIMGRFVISRRAAALGWLSTAVMALAAVGMTVASLAGH